MFTMKLFHDNLNPELGSVHWDGRFQRVRIAGLATLRERKKEKDQPPRAQVPTSPPLISKSLFRRAGSHSCAKPTEPKWFTDRRPVHPFYYNKDDFFNYYHLSTGGWWSPHNCATWQKRKGAHSVQFCGSTAIHLTHACAGTPPSASTTHVRNFNCYR